MTVKLTQYERDPQNGDNVLMSIEYDNPKGSGTMSGVVKDLNMGTMDGMTNPEVRDWILAEVAIERGDELWNQTDNRLNPYLNQELEP